MKPLTVLALAALAAVAAADAGGDANGSHLAHPAAAVAPATPPPARLRVLAVPLVSGRSHLFVMHAIAAELAGRGHDVKMLVVEDDVAAIPTPPPGAAAPAVIPYGSLRAFDWWRDYLAASASASPLQGGHVGAWVAASDALLSDGDLMASLRGWGPHVVVGDIAFLAAHGLAAALRAPLATVSCTGPVDPLHADLLGLSNDAGIVPQFGTGYGAPMTVTQRLLNRAHKWAARAHFRSIYRGAWGDVSRKHGIPLLGSPASAGREILHLYNADWAVEWPRSLPPKVRMIGAILPSNTTDTLPDDLQRIVDAARGRLVYVSFGTTVRLTPHHARTIAAALNALAPTPILWKVSDADLPPSTPLASLRLGPHVAASAWLPQNALFQTGAVAAFVTHGGANGVYEAAFHGVPLVGVPFFGDGADNLAKAASNGFAATLGRGGLDGPRGAAALEAAVRAVAAPGGPARAAARAVSVKLRARPRAARADAADAIEAETVAFHAVAALEAEVEAVRAARRAACTAES